MHAISTDGTGLDAADVGGRFSSARSENDQTGTRTEPATHTNLTLR